MTQDKARELELCPFCGDEGFLQGADDDVAVKMVVCTKCGASGPFVDELDADEDACRLWSTRVFSPPARSFSEADVRKLAIELSFKLDRHGDTDAVERARANHDWPKYAEVARAALESISAPMDEVIEEAVRDAIKSAYITGAEEIHNNYQPYRDPEFGEAASNYASYAVPHAMMAIPNLKSPARGEKS